MADLTVSIGAQDQDGYSEKEGIHGSWPPAGSTVTTTNNTGDFGGTSRKASFNSTSINKNIVALLRFDTSALPDSATITAAVLRLSITGKATGEGRALNVEYYDSGAGISDDDYTVTIGTTAAQVASGTWQAWATSGTVDITLGSLTTINKTGITGFRIGMDGGAPPTGVDIDTRLHFAEYGHATRAIPQLIVTYSGTISMTLTPATQTNAAQALSFTQGGTIYENSWGDMGIEWGLMGIEGETILTTDRRRFVLPPMSP
jgi:hypothetical protein